MSCVQCQRAIEVCVADWDTVVVEISAHVGTLAARVDRKWSSMG